MTINLETEVVASTFDPKTRQCAYTIKRNGKRWTVKLPIDDFAKQKTKQAKRDHLARALQSAMNGNPDAPLGTKTDPYTPSTWPDFDTVPKGAWYLNPADGQLAQK